MFGEPGKGVGVTLTNQLAQEKGDADADGCKIGRLVLFGGKHEHDEDELGGQEHLDEEALRDAGPATQRRLDRHGAREQRAHDGGRAKSAQQLRDHEDSGADGGQGAHEPEG